MAVSDCIMPLRCRAEFDECLKRTTERIQQRLEEEPGEPVLPAEQDLVLALYNYIER